MIELKEIDDSLTIEFDYSSINGLLDQYIMTGIALPQLLRYIQCWPYSESLYVILS